MPLKSHLEVHNLPIKKGRAASRIQSHNLITHHPLHNRTLALLALINITLFLLLAQLHVLPPLHTSYLDIMITFHMPPLETLNHASIFVVGADSPFPRRDFNLTVLLWKMKFWQEDLRWLFLGRRSMCLELKLEDTVSQVKARTDDLSHGSYR